MRTTIKIADRLLAEAKAQAVASGRTLNAVVEDALRESMARRAVARRVGRRPPRADLPTFPGATLRAGVDLDDTAGLLDLMDGADS